MDKDKMIKVLNDALAQEHACQIRYRTHAAVVSGPYAEAVESRLKEIAEDEKEHADTLRDRITALDGTPTMEVAKEDLIPAKSSKTRTQLDSCVVVHEHRVREKPLGETRPATLA